MLLTLLFALMAQPAGAQWAFFIQDDEDMFSQNTQDPEPVLTHPASGDPVAAYNPDDPLSRLFSLFRPGLAAGANTFYNAGTPGRPERSPWTVSTTVAGDGHLVTSVNFNSSFVFNDLLGTVNDVELHRRAAPGYRLRVEVLYGPQVPAAMEGREGVLGMLTGMQTDITYSFNGTTSPVFSTGIPEAQIHVLRGRTGAVYGSTEDSVEGVPFGTTESSGLRGVTLTKSTANPLATVEMVNGQVIYRTIAQEAGELVATLANTPNAQGFHLMGLDIGFQEVDVDFGFAPEALTWPRSGAFTVDTQIAFQWVSEEAASVVWTGEENTNFKNTLNWSTKFTPGFHDTADLSMPGLATIVLPASTLVRSARLTARQGSDTEIHLNGGLWQLGTTAGTNGDFRVEGAAVELRGGTLESSGGSALLVNAAGGSLLELKQAGKLRLPGGVISVGRSAGAGTASLLINGENSLAEAASLVIGDTAAGSLQAFNQGSLFAGTAFVIGADAAGEAVVSGGAEIEMGETAVLRIGQRAQGTLSVENAGSVLLGTGAQTLLGEDAFGSLDVRGVDSTFFGGGADMRVLDHGLLSVRESGEARVSELSVEGGAVAVASAGRLITNQTVSLFAGGSLECAGTNSLLSAGGLFVAGGQLALRDEARASILQTDEQRARMIGGVMDVGAGTVFEAQLLEITGGTLGGTGRVKCTVLHQSGIVSPGSSPGILTIEGDYEMSGGKIVLEIGGPLPGAQHDVLVITGAFDFTGGVIELIFTDSFAPQAGQTFELIDISGESTGAPVVNVRGLEPGWDFEMVHDPETGVLKVNSLSDGTALPPIRVASFAITPAAGGGSGKRILASVTGPSDADVTLEATDNLVLWEPVAQGAFNGAGQAGFDVTDAEATGDRRLYRFITP